MKSFRFPVLWLLLVYMMLPVHLIFAAGSTKNVGEDYGFIFLPFSSIDAGKYASFREGVEGMLRSRLSAGENVQIVESRLSGAQLTQLQYSGRLPDIGAAQSQVFVVNGALFETKAGLKVQVTLVPMTKAAQQAQGEASLRFSKLCAENSLIEAVSSLAEEIDRAIFNRQLPVEQDIEKNAGAFTTRHPEEAYKRGQYTNLATVSGGFGFQARKVGARSRFSFEEDILGVQVVDADGDQKEEVILFFPHKIEIRRFFGRELLGIDSCQLPAGLRVHAVNIADVDRDGVQEIYISATDGLRISSVVLSWRGEGQFIWNAKNIRYYIRPVFFPGEGFRLVIQRRGLARTALRRPGVFLASLSAKGIIEPQKRLPLPDSVNLFDFYYADLDGDGVQELVTVDPYNHLKVYNSANELLWVSEKLYGGSKNYIGPSQGAAVDKQSIENFSVDEDADRELLYLPGRVVIADFNDDGRQEVVVSESNMPGIGFFIRLRPYNSGKIVALSWDGQAMQPFWETGKFRGYLSDFSFNLRKGKIKMPDGVQQDGVLGSLYVATLPSSGSFMSILPGSDTSVLALGKVHFSFAEPEKKQ